MVQLHFQFCYTYIKSSSPAFLRNSFHYLCDCVNLHSVLQLGLRQKEYNPSVQEAWDDLTRRVAFLFANEVCSLE